LGRDHRCGPRQPAKTRTRVPLVSPLPPTARRTCVTSRPAAAAPLGRHVAVRRCRRSASYSFQQRPVRALHHFSHFLLSSRHHCYGRNRAGRSDRPNRACRHYSFSRPRFGCARSDPFLRLASRRSPTTLAPSLLEPWSPSLVHELHPRRRTELAIPPSRRGRPGAECHRLERFASRPPSLEPLVELSSRQFAAAERSPPPAPFGKAPCFLTPKTGPPRRPLAIGGCRNRAAGQTTAAPGEHGSHGVASCSCVCFFLLSRVTFSWVCGPASKAWQGHLAHSARRAFGPEPARGWRFLSLFPIFWLNFSLNNIGCF
jgi:hypothetical protein